MQNKRLLIELAVQLVLLFLCLYLWEEYSADVLNKFMLNGNAISIYYFDLDSDGYAERITYFTDKADGKLTTNLKIETQLNGRFKESSAHIMDKDLSPSTKYMGYLDGYVVGFVKVGSEYGIVVKTNVRGSGGLTGYKVIAFKDGKYDVTYEQHGLRNGIIRITSDASFLIEEFDKPKPEDSNCCSSNIGYKLIEFVSVGNVKTNEVLENSYWRSLVDPTTSKGPSLVLPKGFDPERWEAIPD
jgi:hypothetical protein